jgi:hypothetical protein
MASPDCLEDALIQLRKFKRMAERALEQIDDEDFFWTLDAEANSIALVVKHMAGNMRSRWRDFLTTDGEKPDRYRDTEFERDPESDTREALMPHGHHPRGVPHGPGGGPPPTDPLRLPRGPDRAPGQAPDGRGLGLPLYPQRDVGAIRGLETGGSVPGVRGEPLRAGTISC